LGYGRAVPSPLDRFLTVAGGPVRGEELTFSGTGAANQPVGPLSTWLGLDFEARLVPSRGFVLLGRARLLRFFGRRIAEEYRDGRGRYRAGRRVFTGDAIDRAQYAQLWAWTLVLAPRSALALPEVVAEPDGQTAARVLFPFGNETWQATLRFDSGSGLLTRFEIHRQEPGLRGASPWSLEVTAWDRLDGRAFPAELLSRWREQPAVRLRIESATINPLGR
jgi:hypothetical protein